VKDEGAEQTQEDTRRTKQAESGGQEGSLTLTIKNAINVFWSHAKPPTSGVQAGEVNSGI